LLQAHFGLRFSPHAMPEPTEFAARRTLLKHTLGVAGVLCTGVTMPVQAVRPRAESPEVAIEQLLVESGLAARWGAAMRRDLGWAAQWQAMGSRQALDQLESGANEVGLFLSHPRAAHLEKEGLIHDRRKLARTEVWLVGPADDPAGIRSEVDPARAIAQVMAAQAAGVSAWRFGLDSDAPSNRGPDGPLAQLASKLLAHAPVSTVGKKPDTTSTPTYRLVTQAAWLRQGQERGHRIWFKGHPALALYAEVARSFRGRHPGGRMLVDWLDRPLARSTLRGATGWQIVKG
jgi:hypothetical protein